MILAVQIFIEGFGLTGLAGSSGCYTLCTMVLLIVEFSGEGYKIQKECFLCISSFWQGTRKEICKLIHFWFLAIHKTKSLSNIWQSFQLCDFYFSPFFLIPLESRDKQLCQCWKAFYGKVQLFWEGHKNVYNLAHDFDFYILWPYQ